MGHENQTPTQIKPTRVWPWTLPLVAVWAGLPIIQSSAGWVVGILSPRFVVYFPMRFLFGIVLVAIWFAIIKLGGGWLGPRQRAKRWIALAPFVVLVLSAAWQIAREPPTIENYFLHYFKTPLPPSAVEVKFAQATPADPSMVSFYFECDPAETRQLIEQLQLEELHHFDQKGYFLGLIERIPGAPMAGKWESPRDFLIERESAGIRATFDGEMRRVFLVHEPGLRKRKR